MGVLGRGAGLLLDMSGATPVTFWGVRSVEVVTVGTDVGLAVVSAERDAIGPIHAPRSTREERNLRTLSLIELGMNQPGVAYSESVWFSLSLA